MERTLTMLMERTCTDPDNMFTSRIFKRQKGRYNIYAPRENIPNKIPYTHSAKYLLNTVIVFRLFITRIVTQYNCDWRKTTRNAVQTQYKL